MQIEPTHHLPMAPPAEGLKVAEVSRAKHAKPTQERTLTPLVMPPHAPISTDAEITEEEDKRHDPHLQGERRTCCRRIEQVPILIDLRYGFDRRRVNQRADDFTEHVDEVA